MGLIRKIPLFERPREKAFLYGVDALSNAELIAVILCTGTRDKDVLELSNDLLSEAGNLRRLSEFSLQEISQIKGIKKAKAVRIKAAMELHRRIEFEKADFKKKVRTSAQAASIFRDRRNNFQEHLLLLMVDASRNIIAFKTVSMGSSDGVIVSPNLILSLAMKAFAKGIFIAHNHPSGQCFPSTADREETDRLMLLSSMMGIELIDHLILTDSAYYSLMDNSEHPYE